MPSFDMVVVGAGGGPDETNLSAYLFKPHEAAWEDGVLCLEAGSAQGALNTLLRRNPLLLSSSNDPIPRRYTAAQIYSYLRCFLITHAHLDHISGLVISAGSLRGPRKRIYATKETLKDLEAVFSDRIWPNLASWNEADEGYKMLYSPLQTDNKYKTIFPGISVRTMPVNHGHNERGDYGSVAFFVRHDIRNREFLFFGDVEPDTITTQPRTIHVWHQAAPKIPHRLSAIFIECSWPAGRSTETLFGHLSPVHLMDELVALAREVVKYRRGEQTNGHSYSTRKKVRTASLRCEDTAGALTGLRVYVMHCKDDLAGDPNKPMRNLITSQVKALAEESKLGAQIIAVEQGMRIEI